MACPKLNIKDYFSLLGNPQTAYRRFPDHPKNSLYGDFYKFIHDAMSRLATVSRGTALTATYTRIPGSGLLDTTIVNNGTANVLTVDRNYDNLNRLTSISSTTQFQVSRVKTSKDGVRLPLLTNIEAD